MSSPPPAPAMSAPVRDHLSLLRRLAMPGASLLVVGLSAVTLTVVSPEEPGHYPLCPFRALTGLDCPACGSLRAVHALGHGDLAAAVDRNVLLVALLPVFGWLWLRWVVPTIRGRSPQPPPRRLASVALVVLLAFAVLRNLPGQEWLSSE